MTGYLTPDELIRFKVEAEAAWDRFETFDWKDQAGRKWTIRPGVEEKKQVILIQVGRDGLMKQAAIQWPAFTMKLAEHAISTLDKNPVWDDAGL